MHCALCNSIKGIKMKNRTEVAQEDKWNVDALYPGIERWREEFNSAYRAEQNPHWPEIAAFKGKLGESPAVLKSALETLISTDRRLSKLFTYAHLRHDEEITDDAHKTAFNQILSVYHEFGQETAWFDPGTDDIVR